MLTALLAVLGLVFGVMAFAAPASARSDPVTECEGVVNYTGYDKIEVTGSLKIGDTLTSGAASITVTADKEGTEATAGTWVTTVETVRIVVKSGEKAVPGSTGVPGYSGTWWTGNAADQTDQGLSHITFCYAGEDEPVEAQDDFCVLAEEGGTWTTKTFYGYEDTDIWTWTDSPTRTGGTVLDEYYAFDEDESSCRTEPVRSVTPTLTCALWSVEIIGYESGTPYVVTVDAVQVSAGELGTSPVTVGNTHALTTGDHTLAYTVGTDTGSTTVPLTCGSPPPPPPRCSPTATLHAGELIPVGETEASYCTPPPPPPTPPTEPVPVTVVEPATVAVPAPATVPVPAKVTLPARIPAGDGPTIPVYALALLVLGATALAATTVHLVRTTR